MLIIFINYFFTNLVFISTQQHYTPT